MEFQTFLNLMSKKRKTILGIVALFVLGGAILIAFQQPFKYRTDSQLLIVQERQGVVDAYTASKSSEYLSRVLASVVTSNSFFNKVTASSPSINNGYFGTVPKDQIKKWEKTVSARNINDTGIIAVSVYHPNKAEAEKIAGAVNYILMTEHSAYDGANESVKVRMINQPVTSSFPIEPNIPLILSLAIALGLVTGLMYVYLVGDSLAKNPQPSFSPEATVPTGQTRPTNYSRPAYRSSPQEYKNIPAYQGAPPPNLPRESNNEPHPTPYGHHASVPIPNYFYEDYPNIGEEIEPEEIFKQGDMGNIL